MTELRNIFTEQSSIAVLTPREDDIINDEVLHSKKFKFNEEEIKNYIGTFITKSVSAKNLGYKDIESTLQRINSIPNLGEVIKQPIMLMITMHVLPYVEAFYKNQQGNLPIEVIRKDLLHIFTNLLITDMTDAVRIKHNDLPHISRINIPEAIFKYSCAVAKLMNSSSGLIEIKEEELLKTNDPKLTPYKKFFYSKYSPLTFRNEDDFHLLDLGRENCIFLRKTGQSGQQHYSFIHQEFLDYFATLLPQSINGRRKTIETFMKDYHTNFDLPPQAAPF